MDELTIAFKIESPPSWLPIGRTAENNWRTVEIDCSYWFNMSADGEVVLMYKPSCGMSPYPLLTEREGDNIIWRPKSGELVDGVGRLQAFFEVGTDVIGSSDMISCEVDSSLLGVEPGTDPGQTELPWALDIIEQIAELSGHYPKIIDGGLYIWDSTMNEWVEFEVGGSGGGDDVFIAVRGTTTEAEIREAHGAGKVVICVYQNRVYYLSDDGTVTLRTNPNEQGMVYELIVVGSRWAGINYNLALKSDIPSLAAYRTASAQDEIDSAQNTAIAAKYTKPSGGIPDSDIASAAMWNAKGTYSKPNGGIPKSDLASDVQSSLGKADTALQQHQSLAAYRTSAAQDTIDAGKLDTTGNAYRSASIPMGHLDATSTATVMTATVDGITELRDGVCVWLQNGVVTSASGFTLNVNNLGAKPCYSSLAAASRSTTIFNVNYTMLFVYNSTRVDGGCWDIVYGVDTNTTYTPPKLGFGYGTCTTAAATVAKTASISSYALTTGGIVSIRFDNDVPANATLNITSKGAKAMYYRGAAITAGVIKAGDTATFIYSTYYHLISIDRDEAGSGDAPIQTVKVNGTALVPDANKSVDIPVPTVADVIEETVMVVQLTPTSTDLSGTMNRTGSEILAAYSAGKRIVAEVAGLNGSFEWNQAINGTMVTQFLYSSGGGRELIQVVAESGSSTVYHAYHIAQLPTVTATDNGKSLVVDNGVWAASNALQTKAITDTGGYFTTDTVDGALQEIGAELAGINTLIGSGVIT